MTVTIFLFAAILGYLFGSLSFSRIVGAKVAPGEDLTVTTLQPTPDAEPIVLTGTGATSIGARAGARWGCVTALGDIAKAFVPTLLAAWIWPDTDARFVTAAAAVWGHAYPVYHRFKGGTGLSPAIGGLLALDWLAFPATTLGALLLGTALGDALLAYAGGPLLAVGWAVWRGDSAFILSTIAVNVVYWWAMRPELREHYRRLRGKSIAERRSELIGSIRDSRGEAPWTRKTDDVT